MWPHRQRPSKYRARPTTVDGQRFASQLEARRYGHLCLEMAAGTVTDLRCQVRYPIVLADLDGHDVTVCTYVADFVYMRDGQVIVEDVKGVRTPMYRLKAKLMQVLLGIVIQEWP